MNKKKPLSMNLQYFAANEPNIQDAASLSDLEAKSIDFAYRFGDSLRDLENVLELTNRQAVTEGYTIKTKTAPDQTQLADGNVAEGEIIPLSKVEFGEGSSVTMSSKKWRKLTTYEAIQKYGFDQAVERTDNAIVKEIQKTIHDDLFGFLEGPNTETHDRKGNATLQGAAATAWGVLEQLFEGQSDRTIVFANPMDIAEYLGSSEVTNQTSFGLTYLEPFVGTTVIASNSVTEGEILATVPDNLSLFYIPANSEGGRAFNLVSDPTGFIGVGHAQVNNNVTYESIFISGIHLMPEIENGVIRVPISEVAGA